MTIMEDFQDLRDMLKPRREIVASGELRERIGKATSRQNHKVVTHVPWLWRAAACAAIIVGIVMLVGKYSPSGNNDCIVYVDGKQVSDDAARSIAEADVARMEQFMQAVAAQQAEEEAKVNQFMQHKTLSQ